jgi:NAD+ diphosphatase
MKTFFSGPGLDRADLLRNAPTALDELRRAPGALALGWHHGAPALDEGGSLAFCSARGDEPLFLGFDGRGRPCFSDIPAGTEPVHSSAHFAPLGLLAEDDAPIFAAALSLANWHRRHGFCAVCGAPSRAARGGWSRHCDSCGSDHFPRVDPVVIMLAEHDGRILLGRQPQYPPGRYSALAGFVEVGETLEAAVARELHEEAGIAVTDIVYIASQPWPFPSSLMIGCRATALGEELTIDMTELDDARWFTRDQVEMALAEAPDAPFLPPPRYAIARTLLDHWLANA